MNAPTAWAEQCRSMTDAIVEACVVAPVASGPGALTRELARRLPAWRFRETLVRGGWYRLGALLDAAGNPLAPSLEDWASAELDARQGDLAAFVDDFAGQPLFASRLAGRTHYLVARTGPQADAFLQLEIEDLQALRSPLSFDPEQVPASLDQLLDPRDGATAGVPLGLPAYRFRRIVHVGDVLNRMRSQTLDAQPIHRFVADWEASSAGRATAFDNHWVIGLREHLDRYRQPVFRATPVPAINGEPERFDVHAGTRGLALRDALAGFDRAQGYPFAWFFHMLTTRAMPHWVATAIAEDAAGGWAYIAEKDLAIVKAWLHKPYGFQR